MEKDREGDGEKVRLGRVPPKSETVRIIFWRLVGPSGRSVTGHCSVCGQTGAR